MSGWTTHLPPGDADELVLRIRLLPDGRRKECPLLLTVDEPADERLVDSAEVLPLPDIYEDDVTYLWSEDRRAVRGRRRRDRPPTEFTVRSVCPPGRVNRPAHEDPISSSSLRCVSGVVLRAALRPSFTSFKRSRGGRNASGRLDWLRASNRRSGLIGPPLRSGPSVPCNSESPGLAPTWPRLVQSVQTFFSVSRRRLSAPLAARLGLQP